MVKTKTQNGTEIELHEEYFLKNAETGITTKENMFIHGQFLKDEKIVRAIWYKCTGRFVSRTDGMMDIVNSEVLNQFQ